jgi:hypothetical protein
LLSVLGLVGTCSSTILCILSLNAVHACSVLHAASLLSLSVCHKLCHIACQSALYQFGTISGVFAPLGLPTRLNWIIAGPWSANILYS